MYTEEAANDFKKFLRQQAPSIFREPAGVRQTPYITFLYFKVF